MRESNDITVTRVVVDNKPDAMALAMIQMAIEGGGAGVVVAMHGRSLVQEISENLVVTVANAHAGAAKKAKLGIVFEDVTAEIMDDTEDSHTPDDAIVVPPAM